ncbi:MAG TPA: sulfatase-like hydrolase/transferase [bacterium]
MNESKRNSLITGAGMGMLGGLIVFFSELIMTAVHAEIDIRTYLFFMALYLISGFVGGALLMALLNLLASRVGFIKRFSQNPNFVATGFLFAQFYLYGSYYLNRVVTPGVGVFEPISLGANVILFLLASTALFYFGEHFPKVGNQVLSFLGMSALTLATTVAVNIRFFVWQPLYTQTGETYLATVVFGLAGVLGVGSSLLFAKLFRRSQRIGTIAIVNSVMALITLAAFVVSGRPSAASFQINELTPASTNGLPGPKNIIWIVMDTARRDQISIYGGEPGRTPNIDVFAKDALVMNRAISAAPWTIPSHASMFTGMFPSKHGADRNVPGGRFTNPLSPDNITIAEILQSYGYDTACVAANVAGLSRAFGFDQGFNYYFDSRPLAFHLFFGEVLSMLPEAFRANQLRVNEIPVSSEINGVVYDWLDRRPQDSPFFLFINYMEPHDGVEHIPEPFYSMYGFKKSEYDKVFAGFDQSQIVHFEGEVTPAQQEMFVKLLARRLYFLDHHIGKLLARLQSDGLYEDSFIIITSDHGELNGEHYSFGHNTDLYNELIWVPLLVKYPGAAKTGFSDRTVQNIDIMPELLMNLNIPIPEEVQGQPFNQVNHQIISELFEQKKAQALLFPERYYRDLRAIYSNVDGDSLKYIWSSIGKDEMYDMATDAFERNNLVQLKPEAVKKLEQELNSWLKSFSPIGSDSQGEIKYSKEVEERLRSLGYLK